MTVSQFHTFYAAVGKKLFPARHAILESMRGAPKFVFTDEVMRFVAAHRNDYVTALKAAIDNGRTELPHDPMLVEFALDSGRMFWLFTGGAGSRYRASGGSIDGEGSGVVGGYLPMQLTRDGWRVDDLVRTVGADIGPPPESMKNIAVQALEYAMALHVRGIITRPPRPAEPKLDQARARRALPPITRDYVTVHIGYTTDRDGNRHDYREGGGHPVRAHLRRGHLRNQACGHDLMERKEIWISPVLVNYQPGVIVSTKYLVVP